jgi:hypothetical protein
MNTIYEKDSCSLVIICGCFHAGMKSAEVDDRPAEDWRAVS